MSQYLCLQLRFHAKCLLPKSVDKYLMNYIYCLLFIFFNIKRKNLIFGLPSNSNPDPQEWSNIDCPTVISTTCFNFQTFTIELSTFDPQLLTSPPSPPTPPHPYPPSIPDDYQIPTVQLILHCYCHRPACWMEWLKLSLALIWMSNVFYNTIVLFLSPTSLYFDCKKYPTNIKA